MASDGAYRMSEHARAHYDAHVSFLTGGRLLAYGMDTQPDLTKSPTVVCSSYLVNGHPHRPAARAVERLAEAGVRAVVVLRGGRGVADNAIESTTIR